MKFLSFSDSASDYIEMINFDHVRSCYIKEGEGKHINNEGEECHIHRYELCVVYTNGDYDLVRVYEDYESAAEAYERLYKLLNEKAD